MAKLYVFGIGGTGSRVLRSLTMLLAAGVDVNADEIVPIVIDPDAANADLTRSITLLQNYEKIRARLNFPEGTSNRFFKTSIKRALPNYSMLIKDTGDKEFRDFIGYSSLCNEDKAMMQMLFSEKNLNAKMDVGFKGNPNIGSVVLNQITQSDDFQQFANSFQQGDRVFIISSIFGGTGASGFPLLLKTLRTDKTIPNHALINNAIIGAVTVLPYFKLKQDDDSEIDLSTFISKTKSALAYYEPNVTKNGQINALYYLADNINNTYENNEGGTAQKNDAHLIEMLSATAVVDFCNDTSLLADQTTNKEMGVNSAKGAMSFSCFDDSINSMIRKPMTQFVLMANCLTQKKGRISTIDMSHKFPGNYFSSSFVRDLCGFLSDYLEWLKEMKGNIRSLDLFNLDCGDKPFNVVTGATVYKVKSLKSDYALFEDRLNTFKEKAKGNDDNKLLDIFYLATDKLVKEKFKI